MVRFSVGQISLSLNVSDCPCETRLYGVSPVHTLSSLQNLKGLFPLPSPSLSLSLSPLNPLVCIHLVQGRKYTLITHSQELHCRHSGASHTHTHPHTHTHTHTHTHSYTHTHTHTHTHTYTH